MPHGPSLNSSSMSTHVAALQMVLDVSAAGGAASLRNPGCQREDTAAGTCRKLHRRLFPAQAFVTIGCHFLLPRFDWRDVTDVVSRVLEDVQIMRVPLDLVRTENGLINTAPGKTRKGHRHSCVGALVNTPPWASLLPLLGGQPPTHARGFLRFSKGRIGEFRGTRTEPPSLHPGSLSKWL